MKQYRINYIYLSSTGNYECKREFYNNADIVKDHLTALKRNKNVFEVNVWEREISQWQNSKLQQK